MKIDDQILNYLNSRDEQGLSLLYKYYSSTLYGIAYRVLRNEAFAEDALQKAFLKIWDNISQYDSGKSLLYTWMATIVKNCAIDIKRLKSFEKEEKTETINPSVHINESTFQNQDKIDVNNILDNIDEKYAFVLKNLYLEGYSQSELSEKFDIPIGTIKTRAKKALDIIRENLKKEKKMFVGFFIIILAILLILR